MRSLTRQLLALVGLVALVVAGLAGLAQLKFTSFLSSSVQERLEIVAATSARDFAAATDLGLSIAEVANGEAILVRARAHDPSIHSILVFDLDGNILHAVGEVNGDRADAETLEGFRLARLGITEAVWNIENDERVGSGTLISGSFGQPVGGIVVNYPKTEMAELSNSMARKLTRDGVAVAAGLSLLMFMMLVVIRSRIVVPDQGRVA